MGDGFDKLKNTMSEIKGQVVETKAMELVKDKAADEFLLSLANSPMAAKFKANAERGSENLSGGKLPLLKIFLTGKSEAVLANGEEPKNGSLYYQPTQQEYESVKCHILSISRSYHAKPMKAGDKAKFTQLMAGVIMDETPKPFIMYLTGLKLAPVWDFAKNTISLFTHAKPVPVPMFCVEVKMSTVKVKTEFGQSYTLWLELSKDEKGIPVVVQDEGKFEFLNTMVDEMNEIMNQVINLGANEDNPQPAIEPQDPRPVEIKSPELIQAEEVFGVTAK